MIAANRIKELKYRIKQNDVVYFEKIGASPTIGRENGTFAFSFIDYNEDFNIFYNSLQEEIEAVNSSTGLRAAGDTDKIDVIHYSSIPWIRFSGITHARRFISNDSCPKITFGKMSANENSYTMPIAVNAHHGLADGKHVGEFLTFFQDILNR